MSISRTDPFPSQRTKDKKETLLAVGVKFDIHNVWIVSEFLYPASPAAPTHLRNITESTNSVLICLAFGRARFATIFVVSVVRQLVVPLLSTFVVILVNTFVIFLGIYYKKIISLSDLNRIVIGPTKVLEKIFVVGRFNSAIRLV